jgi:hypothetical protein
MLFVEFLLEWSFPLAALGLRRFMIGGIFEFRTIIFEFWAIIFEFRPIIFELLWIIF